jgi:hypothetical protein
MFTDLLNGCCYGDQNTWNTIPVPGQNSTMNKQIIKHRIIEQNELNKSRTETIVNPRTHEQEQKTSNEYD